MKPSHGLWVCWYFFFFQAEDGIRDVAVTGVQTCALPISEWRRYDKNMEPQWGGEKSLTAAEKDHTLTDRVCAFKTSWAECRDQKRCRHRANGGDFSLDRKSTRLNSSHGYISYAVFCLKKKNEH